MNYDVMMEEQIKNIPRGSKLFLHACCAPCSSAVLERLSDYFEITIFYYNPNISDSFEYQKRILELQKLIHQIHTTYPVFVMEGNYEPERFFEITKGLENEPERGRRCYQCYSLRLLETARMAEKLHFPYFCTTLTLSPHKNAHWINEIGEIFEQQFDSHYLYSDFKKRDGYKRSIELSKKYNLYRQDYCGCVFSKKSSSLD